MCDEFLVLPAQLGLLGLLGQLEIQVQLGLLGRRAHHPSRPRHQPHLVLVCRSRLYLQ